MNFETQTIDNVLVITPLIRRLDASVSVKFKEDIQAMIAQGTNNILLDFSRVDFIDSSCLGALVSLLKTLNGKGELAICSLNNNIHGMFKLTRMDRIFTIGANQPDTLQQMHSVAP
ncbi:Putative anti-sigma factor antagonist TM_1442 [Yersinia frederiksenii]|uniref:Anti-sigma factor antagonist n=2 Tax=Yersinia frederiksenii TaxID=29484 RepID=A0A380PQI7_YERFR|nr:STAS domain-containing protein [Yersinia frederiksenii]ATM95549.1 anti-sigma factor antagonist [Yersinia frederiksenii]KGA43642.1 anti-anti-sigma factor family protein [Yersinia frederiksenii ATCC 33641]MDN0121077.1 STAS domain-containing protein [Yersinia frederiksenii]CFR14803.1 Putative anti-sigma factor antagonist TM_1442 [Yersinia frederiksenii]CNG34459.1 Putative anti-sigma factor antagonist TM_1442 [Yersinia frederiksenii]